MRRRKSDPYEFSDLARYNDEVGHGIVHTPEWDRRMAEQQRLFDEGAASRLKPGDTIIYSDGTRCTIS